MWTRPLPLERGQSSQMYRTSYRISLNTNPNNYRYVFIGGLITAMTFAAIIVWHAMYTVRLIPFAGTLLTSDRTTTRWMAALINLSLQYQFRILHTIVYNFVFGQFRFRLFYGFRETEIVIRRLTDEGKKTCPTLSEEVFEESVMSTILSIYSPSYHSRDRIWSLDYQAILDAHALAENGDIPEKVWNISVWSRSHTGLTTWVFHPAWMIAYRASKANEPAFKVR